MFAIGQSGRSILIHSKRFYQRSASLSMNWLDIAFWPTHPVALAKRFGAPQSTHMSQPLCYRSRPVPPGRTGAALNLTPRAFGWRTIHFAFLHLDTGAVGSGRTGLAET